MWNIDFFDKRDKNMTKNDIKFESYQFTTKIKIEIGRWNIVKMLVGNV
jgi:hypothetical protein